MRRLALLPLLTINVAINVGACASAPAPSTPSAVRPAPAPGVPQVARHEPPVAKKSPAVTHIHGLERVDDYAWMKKKGTPEIESYLTAENGYSAWWMERTQGLRDTLYKEMLG